MHQGLAQVTVCSTSGWGSCCVGGFGSTRRDVGLSRIIKYYLDYSVQLWSPQHKLYQYVRICTEEEDVNDLRGEKLVY